MTEKILPQIREILSQGVDSNSSKEGPVEVSCNHSNKRLNSTQNA